MRVVVVDVLETDVMKPSDETTRPEALDADDDERI
jgi:hypothetical protein